MCVDTDVFTHTVLVCVCVCVKFPTWHLFLLSRQSDHSEFIVRSQDCSPWISTGAGAVDAAQQVKGRLGKDEGMGGGGREKKSKRCQ